MALLCLATVDKINPFFSLSSYDKIYGEQSGDQILSESIPSAMNIMQLRSQCTINFYPVLLFHHVGQSLQCRSSEKTLSGIIGVRNSMVGKFSLMNTAQRVLDTW